MHLLIIDPQMDFMDLPGAALPVAGANEDMIRVSELITRLGGKIRKLSVTLDTHGVNDIGHPSFWINDRFEEPAPFTEVTLDKVTSGALLPVDPMLKSYVIKYLERLAAGGRYNHMIWPEHCLVGGPGHNVHPQLLSAIRNWERQTGAVADFTIKGTSPLAEAYSAVKYEVQMRGSTDINSEFLRRFDLCGDENIVIAGEASSHCVKATVLDLMDGHREFAGAVASGRVTLCTDGMSPVAGFESQASEFLAEMAGKGARLLKAGEIE